MEPAEKKIFSEKKQFRDMKKKNRKYRKNCPKIQNNGYWLISIFRMH